MLFLFCLSNFNFYYNKNCFQCTCACCNFVSLTLYVSFGSDFLNDFFKPITTDMDRLKSYKKHRHGRRIKQLEKFEQKMKEERQKRIRERQKEFFSEIEAHKYV